MSRLASSLAHGLGDLIAGLLHHETWTMLVVQTIFAWVQGG